MIDRTDEYDSWRQQLIDREWDTGEGSECRICGAPIQWSGRGFLHVLPPLARLTGEPGDSEYTACQIAQTFDIFSHIEKTSSHEATV